MRQFVESHSTTCILRNGTTSTSLLLINSFYCPVLHCIVLYCAVLCCTILYYTALYYAALYCTCSLTFTNWFLPFGTCRCCTFEAHGRVDRGSTLGMDVYVTHARTRSYTFFTGVRNTSFVLRFFVNLNNLICKVSNAKCFKTR